MKPMNASSQVVKTKHAASPVRVHNIIICYVQEGMQSLSDHQVNRPQSCAS